jgi:WD40 repeat protein
MTRQLLLFHDLYRKPTVRPKGLRQRLHRFFFGDDIFISYSRSDAGKYATALAARLSEAGYLCFLDQLGTDAHRNMPESLRDKIRKSSALVLIGTTGAAGSRYVREEVAIFNESRRPIFPIDVDNALLHEDWPELAGLACIPETGKRVTSGEPDPTTLMMLRNASRYRRRNQWLRLSLLAGFAALTLTVLAAFSVSSFLIVRADVRAAAAEMTERIAGEKAQKAERDADAAARNEQEARAAADLASGQAAEAQTQAAASQNRAAAARNQAAAARRQQELAEAGTKQAQEQERVAKALERMAKERAETAARQEVGQRATILSRIPGREFDALALAAGAAEAEIGPSRPPSELVLNGLIASVSSLDQALMLRNLTGEVKTAQISPDGRFVFVATYTESKDKSRSSNGVWRVGIWDARTGLPAPGIKPRAGRSIDFGSIEAAFSRDGERLALLDGLGVLYLWNLRNDRMFVRRPPDPLAKTGYSILTAALDGDGQRLAVVAYWEGGVITDKRRVFVIKIDWDTESLAPESEWESVSYPMFSVTNLVFAPDGRLLLSAFSPYDKPSVYDPQRCAEYREPRDCEPAKSVPDTDLAGVTDAGQLILFRGAQSRFSRYKVDTIYVADWQPGGVTVRRTLAGYKGLASSFAAPGGSPRVVTAGDDWVYVSGARASENFLTLRAHDDILSTVRYSSDGRLAATVDISGAVKVWDVRSGVLRFGHLLPDADKRENGAGIAAFSADGERIAVVNRSGKFGMWSTLTGAEMNSSCTFPDLGREIGAPRSMAPRGISFLQDTDGVERVVTLHLWQGIQGLFMVWDTKTCTPIRKLVMPSNYPISTMLPPYNSNVFSSDGMRVVSVGWKYHEVRLWNLLEAGPPDESGERVLTSQVIGLLPEGRHNAVAASFEGGVTLLIADEDKRSFYIWREREQVLRPLRGPLRYKRHLQAVISPGGERAAAVNDAGEVVVWDLNSHQKLAGFHCEIDDERTISPLAFSPDGERLMFPSTDWTARVFPVTAGGLLSVARNMLQSGKD